jgi:hypothetical protein
MKGGMPGMPGGMPNPGMKQMSAADFMSGNRGGFQPPEPPIQPLEPDMQEITQKVFADKVDDLVGLFAGAAGSRQGLKLLQNVLGGVVGAGGKQLANMLTKNPEEIVKMLESNPQRLEQLMHHMSNSKAGAKLSELLQKDPNGAALFAEIESELDEALSEYNEEVAAFEEEFTKYQEEFDAFESKMMNNMQQGMQGGFGGPQGGFDPNMQQGMQGGFGGPQGGFDPNMQQGMQGGFGGPQGGFGGPQGGPGNFPPAAGPQGGFGDPKIVDQSGGFTNVSNEAPVDAPVDEAPVDAPVDEATADAPVEEAPPAS